MRAKDKGSVVESLERVELHKGDMCNSGQGSKNGSGTDKNGVENKERQSEGSWR